MRPALLLALPLALFSLARAGAVDPPVHEIVIGGDTVVGSLTAPGEVRRLPFFLVEGTILDASLTAERGGALHPRLVLLGPDRREDAAATAAMRKSPRGDGVALSGYRIPETGRRWFEVRGDGGTTGGFTLAARCRPARKAAGSGAVEGGGDPAAFELLVPGDAVGSIAVTAAKDGGAVPTFAGLTGPDGYPVVVLDVRPGKAGFSLRAVPLPLAGTYTLLVASPAGADGPFLVKASWKVAKPERRTIDADRVIADPVLVSIDPDHGDPGQVLPVTLSASFATPGAEVRFVRNPFALTVPPAEVTVDGDTVSFDLDLSHLATGLYDVEVLNPDEGLGRLERCFTVTAGPPQPRSISPDFGYDTEVVRARVAGTIPASSPAVALRRGDERIPGENAVVAAGSITADFDLRGRAVGAWDVELTSPGAEPAYLLGAFGIRATPALFAMDPPDNLGGLLVEATITGAGFEAGTLVRLLAGSAPTDPKLPGTDVTVVSPGEMRAVFDTSAAMPAVWDLEIEYTGGRTARLADAFHTVGRPGSVASVLAFVPPAEAPVAVVYNETRNEYLVGWMLMDPRGWMVTFTVNVQRTDALGTPLGAAVSVSTGSLNFPKGDVALGWDPARDEYLVAWSECFRVTPTQNGQPHPNGKDPLVLAEVMAQRLRASDLAVVGANRRISDHTAFPAASATPWYLEDFDNFRPAVAFDRQRGVWEIAWMQAFDTSGLYSTDDYNVFTRELDPVTDVLGDLVEAGIGRHHEGDPGLVWDEAGARVLLAFNARPGDDKAGLDVLLGTPGAMKVVATGGADDLADPALAVDAAGDRVVVTFTRIAGADGTRTARALAVDRTDLGLVLGEEQMLSESAAETFHVRPVHAAHLDRFLLTFTEGTPPAMSLRHRYADASGPRGLTLVGAEEETSGGSGDEGLGAVAYGPGEEAVFFSRYLSSSTRFVEYIGDEFATGTFAAGALLLQRLK